MKISYSKIVLLVISISFLTSIYGQGTTHYAKETLSVDQQNKNLRKFADYLRPAFLNGDYEKLASKIFIPKEFEYKDSAIDEEDDKKGIEVVKHLFEETAADGMTFSTELKLPQKIIAVDNRLFAIIPQITLIKVAKDNQIKTVSGQLVKPGKYRASGFILAISTDNGHNWKFWSAFSEASYIKLFPEIAGKVDLPQIKMPVFFNAQQ